MYLATDFGSFEHIAMGAAPASETPISAQGRTGGSHPKTFFGNSQKQSEEADLHGLFGNSDCDDSAESSLAPALFSESTATSAEQTARDRNFATQAPAEAAGATEPRKVANYVLGRCGSRVPPFAQRPRSQEIHLDSSPTTKVDPGPNSATPPASPEEMFPTFNRASKAPAAKASAGKNGFAEVSHFAPIPQTHYDTAAHGGHHHYAHFSDSHIKHEDLQLDVFSYGGDRYVPRDHAAPEDALDFGPHGPCSAGLFVNEYFGRALDFGCDGAATHAPQYVRMGDMSLIKQLSPPGTGVHHSSASQTNTLHGMAGSSAGSSKTLDDFIKLASYTGGENACGGVPGGVSGALPCPKTLALELRKTCVSAGKAAKPKRPARRVAKNSGAPRRAKKEKRHFDYGGVRVPCAAVESPSLSNNAQAPFCANTEYKRQVVELADQRECAIRRVRHERGSLAAIAHLHPNVHYEKNSYFDIKHPYQQEFTRVELDPRTGAQLMETRSALCAYCEDLNFYELKNSCYSQHMSHSHGIFTDDYLAPDPLYIGTYKVTKKPSSARKTVPRVRCHEGVVCPACYDVVEIRCWSSTSQKKPLSNYLRHFKECHRVDKRRDTFFCM